jgi:putative transposase
MRLPRPQVENGCVHVTHRCQERRLLLGTDIDRKQYVARLFQASRRFRTVRVLDYVVTSNHIHLLAWVPRIEDLSAMMKWLQGTFAGDCNRRVGREGAFWRGRYHPTLVESGRHLSRCLFYLDLNMVRAGVVTHPRDWRFGGYQELSGRRQRYRIIDRERLLMCLGMEDADGFGRWYESTVADLCQRQAAAREPCWSQALAVGSRSWLSRLAGGDSRVDRYIRPVGGEPVEDEQSTCVLRPPQTMYSRLWHNISAARSR